MSTNHPHAETLGTARCDGTDALATPVLVVDDEKDIRDFLALILENEGYRVTACADGREALDYLASHVEGLPAVILLDLLMPVLDGWQFCCEQASDPRFADIPVIVLSAVLDTAPAPPLTHANTYLEKPVEPSEVLELVRLLAKRDPAS